MEIGEGGARTSTQQQQADAGDARRQCQYTNTRPGVEWLSDEAGGSHAKKTEAPQDEAEEQGPQRDGAEVRRRARVADDGCIHQTEGRDGRIRENEGHGHRKEIAIAHRGLFAAAAGH